MKLNKYFKDLTEDVRFKDIKDDSRLVKKMIYFSQLEVKIIMGKNIYPRQLKMEPPISFQKNACVISLNKSRKSQRAFKFNA